MAQILNFGAPQVGVEPAPPRVPGSDYQRIQSNPRMFGAAIGAGEERLGAGATAASKVYSQIAGTEASNDLLEFSSKQLYGDPNDPSQPGLMNLKGADAMRAWPRVQQAIEERRQQALSGLGTVDAQQEFLSRTLYLRRWELSAAGSYVRRQQDSWADAQEVGRQDNLLRLGADAAQQNDPNAVVHIGEEMRDSYVRRAQLRFGTLSTEQRADVVAQADAATAINGIKAVARSDPLRARQMLQTSTALKGPQYDALRREIDGTARGALIDQGASHIMGQAQAGALPAAPVGGNAEIASNNFAGMREPGIAPAGGPGTDPAGWQHFASPAQGIAAISQQLDRYASGATTGQPVNTLRGIVSTWAPPSENPTAQLIDRASRLTGFSPDQPLDMADPGTKAKMIEALIRNERGGNLPAQVDRDMIERVAAGGIPTAPAAGEPQQPTSPAASPATPRDRSLASMFAEAERWGAAHGLPADDIERLKGRIRSDHDALQADQERREREADRARRDGSAAIENQVIADHLSGKPQINATDIASDKPGTIGGQLAALGPAGVAAKTRMLQFVKADPDAIPDAVSHQTAASLLPQIYSGQLATADLVPHYGHDLNRTDFDWLQHQARDVRTSPEAAAFAKRKADFFHAVMPQFDRPAALLGMSGPASPIGRERLYEFEWDVDQKIEAYKKAGKDPRDLLDPHRPDYIGQPAVLKPYLPSMAQQMGEAPQPNLTTKEGIVAGYRAGLYTREQATAALIRGGFASGPASPAPTPAPALAPPIAGVTEP